MEKIGGGTEIDTIFFKYRSQLVLACEVILYTLQMSHQMPHLVKKCCENSMLNYLCFLLYIKRGSLEFSQAF